MQSILMSRRHLARFPFAATVTMMNVYQNTSTTNLFETTSNSIHDLNSHKNETTATISLGRYIIAASSFAVENNTITVKPVSSQTMIIDDSAALDGNKRNDENHKTAIPPYGTKDISRLAQHSRTRLHILLYHPERRQFQLYSLSSRSDEPTACVCKERVVELLIDGLWHSYGNNLSNSFSSSQPLLSTTPLQLLLDTVNDYPYYSCMDHTTESLSCSQQNYPPLMTIGSVPRNSSVALFLHQLPTKHYNQCLYNWRSRNAQHQQHRRMQRCALNQWRQFPSATNQRLWNSLHPQVYWRGTSLSFLSLQKEFHDFQQCDEVLDMYQQYERNDTTTPFTIVEAVNVILEKRDHLIPRCLAVTMSLQAELEWSNATSATTTVTPRNAKRATMPWINAKYTRNKRHSKLYRNAPFFLDKSTSPLEMSKYKYQIDFGGVGGTTWLGTITKLAMPGLLFHHETPTQDWFHTELTPWVHYVPIHTNLSNLYDMYVWAETHPQEARQMARRGQVYARHHISEAHYAMTFDRLFVQRVRRMADAYQPSGGGETVESILQTYRNDGLLVSLIASCDEVNCDFSPMTKTKNVSQSS